ncbi:MAG: FMN-binding protein [Calditrichaeota bacterium]|nr:MAG: FMN-binding protein [Calditrichota bacterium]
MSETGIPIQAPPSVGGSRLMLAMGSVGFIAGILIVFTFQFTQPIIKANEKAFLEQSIFEVFPQTAYKKVFTPDENGVLQPVAEDAEVPYKIYACYDAHHALTGVVLGASGQGFQDVIHLIYGYDPRQQAIVGMKVLQSTETPGLGDKINNDPKFLSNFKHLDVRLNSAGDALRAPVTLIKGARQNNHQISAITGATISSRAVARMIAQSAAINIPLIYKNLKRLEEAGNE